MAIKPLSVRGEKKGNMGCMCERNAGYRIVRHGPEKLACHDRIDLRARHMYLFEARVKTKMGKKSKRPSSFKPRLSNHRLCRWNLRGHPFENYIIPTPLPLSTSLMLKNMSCLTLTPTLLNLSYIKKKARKSLGSL